MLQWFDAHLDLAYIALDGRDMDADVYAVIGPPVAVTFASLKQGGVKRALGTLFVKKRVAMGADAVDGAWCFDSEDEAHLAAWRQVGIYQAWEKAGRIRIEGQSKSCTTNLEVILLMEGAAGVRNVGDMKAFYDAGVRVVGLTWADGTHWAGGNESGGDITPDGKKLVAEMDRLGMVHDVSHLSEKAFWTMLDIGKRPKVATHSNCRALLEGREKNERNLTDDQIKALVKAGGMMGLNLFTNFLAVGRRATIADAVAHVLHIVELTGRADVVGLGSDMDGGFGALGLPIGLEHPRKLHRLAEALSAAGFSDENIGGFAWGNWSRFFDRAFPGLGETK